ncbi:hypothetical protein AAZX31_07G140400 [Glycine max]|uniref:Uncharacterized protein n=1 Tax=Glycine max TaxID=3847 RepID=K7L1V3_SOYBN|nr:hypothetical protein GYH30_018460 [Glycine max]KRH49374.1 hypothetical protein GLYMA_07G149800v4 [Glycine max]
MGERHIPQVTFPSKSTAWTVDEKWSHEDVKERNVGHHQSLRDEVLNGENSKPISNYVRDNGIFILVSLWINCWK